MLGSPVRVRPVAPLICGAVFLSIIPNGEDKRERSIAIVPLGNFPTATIQSVKSELSKAYNCSIVVLAPKSLPRSAYYAPRDRYRADKLIAWADQPAIRQTKTILLTNVDISATARGHFDWGVFGLGSVGGPTCVVSSYRLKGSMSNLIKVSIHEIGHTLGRQHCPTYGCVMQDAEGTVRTVESETGKFCPICRKQLGNWLRSASK